MTSPGKETCQLRGRRQTPSEDGKAQSREGSTATSGASGGGLAAHPGTWHRASIMWALGTPGNCWESSQRTLSLCERPSPQWPQSETAYMSVQVNRYIGSTMQRSVIQSGKGAKRSRPAWGLWIPVLREESYTQRPHVWFHFPAQESPEMGRGPE